MEILRRIDYALLCGNAQQCEGVKQDLRHFPLVNGVRLLIVYLHLHLYACQQVFDSDSLLLIRLQLRFCRVNIGGIAVFLQLRRQCGPARPQLCHTGVIRRQPVLVLLLAVRQFVFLFRNLFFSIGDLLSGIRQLLFSVSVLLFAVRQIFLPLRQLFLGVSNLFIDTVIQAVAAQHGPLCAQRLDLCLQGAYPLLVGTAEGI